MEDVSSQEDTPFFLNKEDVQLIVEAFEAYIVELELHIVGNGGEEDIPHIDKILALNELQSYLQDAET
jgi:hypothetical protein